VAIMTPAIFLLGVGPIARWKKAALPELGRRLRWAFAVSVIAGLTIPFLVEWKPLVSLGLTLSIWVVSTAMVSFADKFKAAREQSILQRAREIPRNYYGMQLAHIGVAVTIAGITLVTGYEVQQDLRMNVGDSTEIGGYRFDFHGVSIAEGPNYDAIRAEVEVFQNGKQILRMHPEKRTYRASGNDLKSAAIESGVFRDLFVALGDPIEGTDAWSFRIQYKPFVDWIWAGAVFMAVGGALAFSDRRYNPAKSLGLREAA